MTDDKTDKDKAAAFQIFNHYADLPEMIYSITNHRNHRNQQKPKHLIGPATPRTGPKIGRNEACGCWSGAKFKHCCGK